MSDVLDQPVVDALLAAVETGDLSKPAASGSAPAPVNDPAIFSYSPAIQERDVRDYDFKRPERVSKDQYCRYETQQEYDRLPNKPYLSQRIHCG